jgi:hypothetical protein
MKGKIAKCWREFDLSGIISELLLTLKPRSVFGFFAGSPSWSDAGAKYRYFFAEGLHRALDGGLDVGVGGCFFRSSGLGTKSIMDALGRAFMDFAKADFADSFATHISANPRQYGSTVVNFDQYST